MVRQGMLTAVVCGVLLAAAGPANATPSWTAPVVLAGPSAEAGRFRMAVDADGVATAVWIRNGNTIMSATRSGSGPWSAPVVISDSERSADDLRVQVNLRGDAIATWSRQDSTWTIRSAERPAGSGWSPAAVVGDGGVSSPQFLETSLNSNGAALVAWQYTDADTANFIRASTRQPRGAWEAPAQLSSGQGQAPEVALDNAGGAIVLWDGPWAVTRPSGGAWSSPVRLAPNGGRMRVAVDASGNALAVWTGSTADGRSVIQSSYRFGGTWQEPVNVSDPGYVRYYGTVAVDPAGNAVAAWESREDTTPIRYSVQAATRRVHGTWDTPVTFATGSLDEIVPDVGIGPQNKAFVLWDFESAAGVAIQSAIHEGDAWQPPATISTPNVTGIAPSVWPLASGDVLATWLRGGETTGSAVYDATAPALGALSIPATAVAGVPVAFSAAPTDAWSAVTTTWLVGATPVRAGNAVTYTFAKPGTFTVGVSAADAAANAATAGQTVTVAELSAGKLRVAPSKFKASKKGAKVTYTLNGHATVRFTVERPGAGRKVGSTCVKQTKSNRKRKRCTRYTALKGRFDFTRDAGASTFVFDGRLNRRKLAPGSYRLVATPTAGTHTGAPSTANFTIKR